MKRRLIATLVGTLLLGGCSADPQPTQTSSPDTSSTGPSADKSTEPPVPPPSVPSEITNHDLTGAEAAAKYFLSLYPYVYASGDLETWRAMSHPECIFCNSVTDNVTSLHEAGGYRSGGEVTLEVTEAHPPVEGNDHYAVWLKVEEKAFREHSGDGDTMDQAPSEHVAIVALADISGEWIIRGVQIEDV